MTQLPAVGRPQKDIRIKVGSDNYEKQVSDVNFTPKPGETWQGGTPDAKLTDEEWECNITFVQAWDEPTSFARWALAHAGETVKVEYKPHADNSFTLYADVTIAAPTIGGKVGKRNESTLACPSTKPTTVAPSSGGSGSGGSGS